MNVILKIYEYNIRTHVPNHGHSGSEINRKKSTRAGRPLCTRAWDGGCVLFSACSISLCVVEIVSIDGASKAAAASALIDRRVLQLQVHTRYDGWISHAAAGPGTTVFIAAAAAARDVPG